MNPSDLGLPPKFGEFREFQEDAILSLASPARFQAHAAPTGFGKSLVYTGQAMLAENQRWAILTANKPLQDQLDEYAHMVDIRGQNNYVCDYDPRVTADEAECHSGFECDLKQGGCAYYDQLARARSARVIKTNYSCWMYTCEYGKGLGHRHALVLDEAHHAPDQLSDFLSVKVGPREAEELGNPPEISTWRQWAARGVRVARERHRAALRGYLMNRTRHAATKVRHYKHLLDRLHKLTLRGDDWIMEESEYGFTWHPVWPAPYAEEALYRRVGKVLLFSATLNKYTLKLMGIEEDYEFYEYPSSFRLTDRPVTALGAPKIGRGSSMGDLRDWVGWIDAVLEGRQDRKGIIHTVSYARRDLLLHMSRHSRRFISHGPGGALRAVEEYRRAGPGAILVSPTLGTGWDFPGSQCEYQIIAKIPFPDKSSRIVAARQKVDREYPYYVAMQELVQMAGRGNRFLGDRCETFITDGHFTRWFWPRYKKFAPGYFKEAVRYSSRVPNPPPALVV